MEVASRLRFCIPWSPSSLGDRGTDARKRAEEQTLEREQNEHHVLERNRRQRNGRSKESRMSVMSMMQ